MPLLEKENDAFPQNGISKSKSDIVSLEDDSEISVNDPNYKIKKNLSLNQELENDSKALDKSIDKEFVPNNKCIDQELWKSLQPFVNGKKISVLVERIKKGLPEKEANYLVEKLLKIE